MKAEIISIDKMFDEATCTYYWHLSISCDDLPDLKMGKCEVKQ